MTAAITPGPNNIILSTHAVNYGFKETVPLILGVFFGFLSILTISLLGLGKIYHSFPTVAMIIKIIAVGFLTYLSFKIFNSKNSKKFTFKDIYFFQIINPKGMTMAMSSSAIFLQNEFPYYIEFILIFSCFIISTASSAIAWAAIGHLFKKYLNDTKKIIYFNRIMAILLLSSIVIIVL